MHSIKKIGLINLAAGGILAAVSFQCNVKTDFKQSETMKDTLKKEALYLPPDTFQIQQSMQPALVRYGRELVINTRKYLGAGGKITQVSNQLNCQSCHLEAGAKTAAYSANFLGVAANYPLFRERSGIWETIQFRINECMVRSMNGKPLDTAGLEMKAITAYILWLGKEVPPKIKPLSSSIEHLPYLQRAADTLHGRQVFIGKCQLCHGTKGQGGYSVDSALYYPPLWGVGSYNTAAGMYRLSHLAGFVKNNMPYGVSYGKSQLTNEECWDVAAYINSNARPHKNFPNDWPDVSKKAIDYPFGPYADSFSEQQHKYGPFEPIAVERKKKIN